MYCRKVRDCQVSSRDTGTKHRTAVGGVCDTSRREWSTGANVQLTCPLLPFQILGSHCCLAVSKPPWSARQQRIHVRKWALSALAGRLAAQEGLNQLSPSLRLAESCPSTTSRLSERDNAAQRRQHGLRGPSCFGTDLRPPFLLPWLTACSFKSALTAAIACPLVDPLASRVQG